MRKNILILVNKYTTITKFRLEVVKALVEEGYNVYVSVPAHEKVKEIEDVGAHIIETPFEKDGTDPIKDLKLMLKYRKIIRDVKADIVLTYTIKPNVYGGMAATLEKVPYVANITGLGTALENKGLIGKIALVLYKIGLKNANVVFFQNESNREFFKQNKISNGEYKMLPGSGVNLNKFELLPYPEKETIDFAFISRIMKEKGIEEYVEAAKVIKNKFPNTIFHVGGFGDEYYENKMKELDEAGIIKYHGLLDDVRVLLKEAHCVIHPTYYPEGMSNVLLESASSGRPIISTNRPGCREAIDDCVNGFIIEEKDVESLIRKIETFMEMPFNQKYEMGLNGRKKMEKQFDRQIVVDKYLSKCREVLER